MTSEFKTRLTGQASAQSAAKIIALALMLASLGAVHCTWAAGRVPASGYVDAHGVAHLPPLAVPPSGFMSPEARAAFIRLLTGESQAPPINGNIAVIRAFYDRYNEALVLRAKKRYPVKITHETMNGVRTEVVVPAGGVAPANKYRVLMNLHGGAFLWGEGSGEEIESIPVASVGKIEVVTVAYREGPEYKFPAASEDVAAVYRALLRKYPARNIGIYGCSAGGILTAESTAWFEKVKLPMPGAIGTFCGSAGPFGGDSSYTAFALTGQTPLPGARTGGLSFSPYFSNVSLSDPLVFPAKSRRILAKFPPTLLIGGSRDFSMSSMFHTQQALSAVGVDAELHVWDGMWHGFFIDSDLPESQQAYRVIVSFFARHLGRGSASCPRGSQGYSRK
ncbi:MAG: alpha/beta hydrolase [Steroidobacteraceae bacterium]